MLSITLAALSVVYTPNERKFSHSNTSRFSPIKHGKQLTLSVTKRTPNLIYYMYYIGLPVNWSSLFGLI